MMRWGLAVLAAFALWTLSTSVTLVRPGELAIVRRFGRLLDEKPAPGLHLSYPWGIDVVTRIAVDQNRLIRIGTLEVDDVDVDAAADGQLLTGDHNLVNVQAEIRYRVDPEAVEHFALNADRVDGQLVRLAEAALAEWVAGRGVDEVLLTGKTQLPRVLHEHVQAGLALEDAPRLGVAIIRATVTSLSPPAEVKQAFDQVTEAQSAIRTKVALAEQESKRQLRNAEAEALRLKRLAQSYAHQQEQQAAADAESFRGRLAAYQQIARVQPDYVNTLWLDEMTRIYARMRAAGRLDLLDHHLGADGLSITQFPLPRKRP